MSTLKDVIYNILAECYSFAKESYSVKASIRVMDEVNKKLEFLRPTLRLFAEDMEKDLRKNDFKGGWLDGELNYYRGKALEHLTALEDIESMKFITIISKKKAIAHCVKSANYSMMIVDNLVEEIKKEMEEEWDRKHAKGENERMKKRKMCNLAHMEKRKHYCWAVVNPGNAGCHSIHSTKSEANSERRENASAYVVVRAFVIPDYEWDRG